VRGRRANAVQPAFARDLEVKKLVCRVLCRCDERAQERVNRRVSLAQASDICHGRTQRSALEFFSAAARARNSTDARESIGGKKSEGGSAFG
jgi:hypothetical protein